MRTGSGLPFSLKQMVLISSRYAKLLTYLLRTYRQWIILTQPSSPRFHYLLNFDLQLLFTFRTCDSPKYMRSSNFVCFDDVVGL
jgi:hypothetical protein